MEGRREREKGRTDTRGRREGKRETTEQRNAEQYRDRVPGRRGSPADRFIVESRIPLHLFLLFPSLFFPVLPRPMGQTLMAIPIEAHTPTGFAKGNPEVKVAVFVSSEACTFSSPLLSSLFFSYILSLPLRFFLDD